MLLLCIYTASESLVLIFELHAMCFTMFQHFVMLTTLQLSQETSLLNVCGETTKLLCD